ncbi:MAG: OmpA family protein, partial [Pseudohongiellaceae bacterium]
HEIADYGKAEFSQPARGRLAFRLRVAQPATVAGDARLMSLPADWQHYEQRQDLGTLPIVPGETPFYLDTSGARRVMAELEAGLTPTFVYQDWTNRDDIVRVHLSPLTFNSAVAEFRACVQGLLPYTFDDVRKTVLLYNTNQTRLSQSQRNQLQPLVRYASQDRDIRQVVIEGYTDSIGLSRVNLVVANQRIDAVRAYLIEQGVDSKLIKTRAYDESVAKFSNRTEEGRSKNRRVEITLGR